MGINTAGLIDLIEDLKDLGELDNDELTGEMLEAGAEKVVEGWKEGIKKTVIPGGRSTGDMENSVATTKGLNIKNGVSSKDIYPQGKDKKGVRNAEKAFILNYGKSGQLGTRFVEEVEAKTEDTAIDAMEEVFNNYLDKKGFD